jgi:hypothetical protein
LLAKGARELFEMLRFPRRRVDERGFGAGDEIRIVAGAGVGSGIVAGDEGDLHGTRSQALGARR